MSTNDSLQIPPAILAIRDATPSEKMLLSIYLNEPSVSSYRTIRILGVSRSGLKKIKGRLIAKGLLRPTIDGYRVIAPGLVPASEGGKGHFVTKSEAGSEMEKVAPRLRRMASIKEIQRDYNRTFEFITNLKVFLLRQF